MCRRRRQPSSWSWVSVVCVVCPADVDCRCRDDRVGLLVVGVCCSQSRSPWSPISSHLVLRDPRCLCGLRLIVGMSWRYPILAGLHCFRYPFCLVDVARVHLEMSFVQKVTSWSIEDVSSGRRGVWQSCSLSIHPALSEDPRRDPIC